jgi:hypothetical protein
VKEPPRKFMLISMLVGLLIGIGFSLLAAFQGESINMMGIGIFGGMLFAYGRHNWRGWGSRSKSKNRRKR